MEYFWWHIWFMNASNWARLEFWLLHLEQQWDLIHRNGRKAFLVELLMGVRCSSIVAGAHPGLSESLLTCQLSGLALLCYVYPSELQRIFLTILYVFLFSFCQFCWPCQRANFWFHFLYNFFCLFVFYLICLHSNLL